LLTPRRHARAAITVRATDTAGNATTLTRTVNVLR
jgi:hypothetical protein